MKVLSFCWLRGNNGMPKGIENLDALSGMKNLENIDAKNSGITDVSGLANMMKLWEVQLNDNQITDVKPLASVKTLVNRGNDFYIEGTLINNGTINVMGADSISTDFINYSVMSVQKGGDFINNGAVNLFAAFLSDTSDRGPVGGQLRIFDGSFANSGSVFLKAGAVNTHGGMLAVIEGSFTNNAVVIVDGFQIDIAGTFINCKGAVVINNSYISTEKGGTFTNNGTLSGGPVAE